MNASLIQITGTPAQVRQKVVETLARKRRYTNVYRRASKVRFVGSVTINADRRIKQ